MGVTVTMSAREIDRHVGARIRQRREALGISQGRLGRHLGLTFSQIQKYEKGSNRVGAGRLYQIADFLGVTPGHFFAGLGQVAGPDREDLANGNVRREEFRALTEAFSAIPDTQTRSSVLALVRSLTMARRNLQA